MSKKNVLMLVRTGIVAGLALVFAVIASLAWFIIGLSPSTGYLDVEVFGRINATVTLAKMDGLSENEMRQGYVSNLAIMQYHSFTDITSWPGPTEAYLVPGLGDYYRITVTLNDPGTVAMTVELIGAQWNAPQGYRAALSQNIWIRSFFAIGGDNLPQPVFVWDNDLGDYKSNVTFVSDRTIGNASAASVTDLYYYFYLDTEFESEYNGQLFTVDHVRVILN